MLTVADEFKRIEEKKKRTQKTGKSRTHIIKIATYSVARLANVFSKIRKDILN